jgi:RNA polymerase sigma-70 factor (ECF subfamily)
MRGHRHDEREERFLGLLRRNRRRIERICRSWTDGGAERDDLRSEIHFQLWRSLPSFDGRAGEDTWLFRVALNTALLHARRRGRRRDEAAPDGALDAASAARPAAEPAAHRRLEERERRRRLGAAVRALPPVDRTLVSLWLEELTYRQIAEVTGLSENHVGVRLHRARKRLAAELDAGEA